MNPNTMQRALAELERENLLNSERTSGRFVTKDIVIIEAVRKEAAEKIVGDFLRQMHELGFNKGEIESFFRQMDMEEQGVLEAI